MRGRSSLFFCHKFMNHQLNRLPAWQQNLTFFTYIRSAPPLPYTRVVCFNCYRYGVSVALGIRYLPHSNVYSPTPRSATLCSWTCRGFGWTAAARRSASSGDMTWLLLPPCSRRKRTRRTPRRTTSARPSHSARTSSVGSRH